MKPEKKESLFRKFSENCQEFAKTYVLNCEKNEKSRKILL